MEGLTLLLFVVVLLQGLILWRLRKERASFYRDVKVLYASIAADLNAVTRTIALYATPNPQNGGEGIPSDPAVDAARRKAELWRVLRPRR